MEERDASLDFSSAMEDFGRMFPSLEPAQIESVLRANNGAVDDTIDQLLAVSLTQSPQDQTLPKTLASARSPEKAGARVGLGGAQSDIVWGAEPPAHADSRLPARLRWDPPLLLPLPGDFLRLPAPMEPQKRAPSSRSSEAARLKDMAIQNTYQRHAATDPIVAKYLEDERVAIMLQNREFVRELRMDRDFVAALEREASLGGSAPFPAVSQSPSTSAGPSPSTFGPRKPSWGSKARKKLSGLGGGPKVPPYEAAEAEWRMEAALPAHMLQGYGGPGPVADQDAFIFTKKVGSAPESEEAFAERVRHMGKTSRQKFALMARRFAKKSKGASGLLSKDEAESAGFRLLDDADDRDDHDGPDQLPAAQQSSAGYNQPHDTRLGISDKTDLHEGHLFSR